MIELAEKAGDKLDLIIIPKVKAPRDLWFVDTLLSGVEMRLKRKRRIGLEVLIEEVEALINVEEIARCTPRLEAIIFGPGDFSASQGVRFPAKGAAGYPGDMWHYARNKIVVAARAAGIDAIDGPFADFHDPEGYRREATWASILGFVGKWAIHPSQIDLANEVYSPTKDEVARARKMAEVYAKAEADGLGAVTYEGVMIDVASVRGIRHVIERADLIGMYRVLERYFGLEEAVAAISHQRSARAAAESASSPVVSSPLVSDAGISGLYMFGIVTVERPPRRARPRQSRKTSRPLLFNLEYPDSGSRHSRLDDCVALGLGRTWDIARAARIVECQFQGFAGSHSLQPHFGMGPVQRTFDAPAGRAESPHRQASRCQSYHRVRISACPRTRREPPALGAAIAPRWSLRWRVAARGASRLRFARRPAASRR